MSRLVSLKRLTFASLATGGIVVACRATRPGEAPPLAPRPDRVEPSANPIPGAPDPLAPGPAGPPPRTDAGVPGVPPGRPVTVTQPVFESDRGLPAQSPDAGTAPSDAPVDAPVDDADCRPEIDALELLPAPDPDPPTEPPGAPLL